MKEGDLDLAEHAEEASAPEKPTLERPTQGRPTLDRSTLGKHVGDQGWRSNVEMIRGSKKKAQNILSRMEVDATRGGPLSLLARCVTQRLKIKVWTRSYKHVRGICTGYVIAYDRHMNLAMFDVDEIFKNPVPPPTIESDSEKKKKRFRIKKKRQTKQEPEAGDNIDLKLATSIPSTLPILRDSILSLEPPVVTYASNSVASSHNKNVACTSSSRFVSSHFSPIVSKPVMSRNSVATDANRSSFSNNADCSSSNRIELSHVNQRNCRSIMSEISQTFNTSPTKKLTEIASTLQKSHKCASGDAKFDDLFDEALISDERTMNEAVSSYSPMYINEEPLDLSLSNSVSKFGSENSTTNFTDVAKEKSCLTGCDTMMGKNAWLRHFEASSFSNTTCTNTNTPVDIEAVIDTSSSDICNRNSTSNAIAINTTNCTIVTDTNNSNNNIDTMNSTPVTEVPTATIHASVDTNTTANPTTTSTTVAIASGYSIGQDNSKAGSKLADCVESVFAKFDDVLDPLSAVSIGNSEMDGKNTESNNLSEVTDVKVNSNKGLTSISVSKDDVRDNANNNNNSDSDEKVDENELERLVLEMKTLKGALDTLDSSSEDGECNSEDGRCNSENDKCNSEDGKCNSDDFECNSEDGECNSDDGECNSDDGKCNSDEGQCNSDEFDDYVYETQGCDDFDNESNNYVDRHSDDNNSPSPQRNKSTERPSKMHRDSRFTQYSFESDNKREKYGNQRYEREERNRPTRQICSWNETDGKLSHGNKFTSSRKLSPNRMSCGEIFSPEGKLSRERKLSHNRNNREQTDCDDLLPKKSGDRSEFDRSKDLISKNVSSRDWDWHNESDSTEQRYRKRTGRENKSASNWKERSDRENKSSRNEMLKYDMKNISSRNRTERSDREDKSVRSRKERVDWESKSASNRRGKADVEIKSVRNRTERNDFETKSATKTSLKSNNLNFEANSSYALGKQQKCGKAPIVKMESVKDVKTFNIDESEPICKQNVLQYEAVLMRHVNQLFIRGDNVVMIAIASI